jgi:hypothetical protein
VYRESSNHSRRDMEIKALAFSSTVPSAPEGLA